MNRRNVRLYNLSKFINTTGNFVTPLITYILLKTLKVDENYIGVLIMLISMMKIPGLIIGGRLGDKCNYEKIASYFPIVCGGLMLMCSILIQHKYIVIFLICLSKGISGATSPANVKFMDALASNKYRKDIFASVYLVTNIGTAIASLLGGFIYTYSCELVFVLDGITRMLSGIILLAIKGRKKEIVNEEESEASEKEVNESKKIVKYIYDKGLWGYMALTVCFMYVYAQYSYAIPLQLDKLFGLFSAKVYGVILFFNCVTVVLSTPFIKKICRNIPVLKCIKFAFFLFFVGFGMYIFNLNMALVIASTIIWSCGEVIFGINELVYISENTEPEYLARTISIYDSLQNIVIAISPMINSMIIMIFDLRVSWFFLSVFAIIGSVASILMHKKSIGLCRK